MMRPGLVRVIPLAAIVLMAIALRLIFFQGIVHFDDLLYSHLARRLADGISPFTQPLPPRYGAIRIGLYAPVAVLYWIFGTSVATTLAWPFLLSILGVVGAYAVGRMVHGETAGLLAAFVFAVLPTSVAAGTALLGDGPIAALSIGVVFCLLLSDRTQGWKSAAALVASLACFGLGVVCKPLILLLLPFFVFFVVSRLKRSLMAMAGAALAVAGAITAYVVYFGRHAPQIGPAVPTFLQRLALTAIDAWSQLVVGQPEFSWLAPLWIVSVAALLAWRKSEARVVLLWLGFTFLYSELGTRALSTYTPIVWYDESTPARHFLFVATPAVILTGIYLAQGLKEQAARRLVILASIVTAVAAWAGSRGATNMNWGVTGEAHADLPFATLSGIATIVVVFGGIASPAFLRAGSALMSGAGTCVLVVAIGLASLQHSYLAANRFKSPWVETLPEALRLLESQRPLPIMAQNETFAQRLDQASGFRLGFQSTLRPFVKDPRVQVAPADVNAVTDAYIVVDEYTLRTARDARLNEGPAYLRDPPARWVKIGEFGKYPGNHLKVYRVSYGTAGEDLIEARAAVSASPTPVTLHNLMNAAAGAGASCEAVRAWFDVRAMAAQEVASFDPVRILSECYKTDRSAAGPNLLQNADFSSGLASWPKHADAEATIAVTRDPDGAFVWHGDFRNGNGIVIYQERILKPDTAYIYEADVKTTVPIVSLYWQSDEGRFLEIQTYPEWTHLTSVFLTPHWNGEPKTTWFHPVLMKGAGEAWIKGPRLSEFQPPK